MQQPTCPLCTHTTHTRTRVGRHLTLSENQRWNELGEKKIKRKQQLERCKWKEFSTISFIPQIYVHHHCSLPHLTGTQSFPVCKYGTFFFPISFFPCYVSNNLFILFVYECVEWKRRVAFSPRCSAATAVHRTIIKSKGKKDFHRRSRHIKPSVREEDRISRVSAGRNMQSTCHKYVSISVKSAFFSFLFFFAEEAYL